MMTRNPMTVPPDIQDLIESVAAKENRTVVAVLTEAVEQYQRRKRLAELGRYGRSRAERTGVQPSDIETAIQEDRAQQSANRASQLC